jgi:HEAT repeat protein
MAPASRVALETLLAKLYPKQEDTYRLVDAAEIPQEQVSFRAKGLDNWYEILREADSQGKLEKLLGEIRKERSDNADELDAALAAWREAEREATSTGPGEASVRSVWRGRGIAPVSGIQALLSPGAIPEGKLALDLGRIFTPEGQTLSNAAVHRSEELEFLRRMELFIEEELRKSGDEHFVELSMRFADPSAARQSQFERSFSLAFGEIEKDAPIIPSLVGLQEALNEYHSLVLLGGPGSGKTTVLQHLALRMIGAYRLEDSELLPLYLPLTKYVRAEPTLDLVKQHVVGLVGEEHFVARNCHGLAKFGRFLLILDGLDQMPNRRSETIRLEQLRRLEMDLRRVDRALKVVRFFRQKKAAVTLIQGRQAVSDQIAPTIDLRERYIEKLPDLYASPVITSCRLRDFVGSPNWQSLVVLPMDGNQVREFVEKYSPSAVDAVEKQWQSATGTRSLIGNPFYLRMLSEALKRTFTNDAQKQEFRRASAKRGKLLEFLLLLGLERELRDQTDLQVQEVLDRLGQLAYSMLEHNIIGAVPYEALTRWLGEELPAILKVAEDVNLLTVREGPPLSVDFNHQLFLEFLLALHLKNQRRTEDGFQEGLLLLARRGDRWAETVTLLFELVGDEDRTELVTRFVDALREPTTWDIATRVLAGIGDAVAPSLVELLGHEDELARRGAAKVLGKIRAVQYAQDLAALRNDRSWRVRREAVDSLVALKQTEAITLFTTDDQPSVVRSAFGGLLQLQDSPAALIREVVGREDPKRQVQMAWAMHDLFGALCKRLSETEMAGLLRDLLDHDNEEVKVLAYLMVSQASESTKRSLKKKLMIGALEVEDVVVNSVARRVVSDFLTPEDIRTIELLYEKVKGPGPFAANKEQRKAMRAFSLLAEARQKLSPEDFLGYFISAPPTEIQLLTQRLSRQADPMSMSLLVHLVGKEHASLPAITSLIDMGSLGVAHLLAALDDPDPVVQLNAAKFLSFCSLPRNHARRVRATLRREHVRTHLSTVIQAQNAPPVEGTAPGCIMVGFVSATPFVLAFAGWLLSWTLGARVPYFYWLRFVCTDWRPTLMSGSNMNLWLLQDAERHAWIGTTEKPNAEFWLARGRLLRLAGSLAPARKAINRSLHLSPTLAPARYELALLERSGGNLDGARKIIEAEDGRFIEPQSELEDLDLLLQIDERRGRSEGSPEDSTERARILVRLGLWKEALPAVKALFEEQSLPADAYLLLYRCFDGVGETRRALAAALAQNESGHAGIKVPTVEIENLRWLHREESFPVYLRGKLEILIDLKKLDQALAMLRLEALLPEEGEPLAEEHIQRLRGLDPNLLKEVTDLLAQLGREAEVSDIEVALESEV